MSEYQRSNTDWFHDAKWGVFMHYLADTASATAATGITADEWNRRIDHFDVHGLAEQLAEVKAGYFFITIGQNSGFYLAPNPTYDEMTGILPSKCARRDLISDLYDVLNPEGIKLMVYIPSGAPANDPAAMEKLGWQWGFKGKEWGKDRTGLRLVEFQLKWEAILRDWSLRWGKKVCGWWVDGCYFADEMYRFPDPPNYESFARALKAGNPDSIVAFNPGTLMPLVCHSEYEDFIAGEVDKAFPATFEFPGYLPLTRFVDGAQYHVLSFIGHWWGQGKPRFCDEFVIGFTKNTNAFGGVVSWDVAPTPEGRITQPAFQQLIALRDATR
jgi:hypothetical protein